MRYFLLAIIAILLISLIGPSVRHRMSMFDNLNTSNAGEATPIMNRKHISQDEVSTWIIEQGAEKDATSYYLDGLTYELANVDQDAELEVLARIDSGVHLGMFFLFDQQSDRTYKLLFERPWHVYSWELSPLDVEGPETPMQIYQIFTRTGGTGVDVKESHLMYMSESGAWTEAWKGTLKDRSVFQDNYHLIMGSYQLNDDNGQLIYWQTVMDMNLDSNEQVGDSLTTTKLFEMDQGVFVEKK